MLFVLVDGKNLRYVGLAGTSSVHGHLLSHVKDCTPLYDVQSVNRW